MTVNRNSYLFLFIIMCIRFALVDFLPVSAQENMAEFPIVFGWRTSGSEELLARKATAIKALKKDGVALSFGSLLGATRIVQYHDGVDFLEAAREAGIDFVIPAADEFMFGADLVKDASEVPETPRFVSANLVDEKTHKPIVDPYVVIDAAGKRICIIAMSDVGIIMQAADNHVAGLDILPYDEAFENIVPAVIKEHANLVIVAGRMDRTSVLSMAERYAFIDAFITNNQSKGFADSLGTTSIVSVAGKPVYIGSEAGDHLGLLTFSWSDRAETREFRDITVGSVFPPDKAISASLLAILEKLRMQYLEESTINKTGTAVAGILGKEYKTDVVFLERGSIYYFPLKDSLTVYDIRRVVRPDRAMTKIVMKGEQLKSVWARSINQADPSLRLLSAGITSDGKVNGIPIQDTLDYTVLITPYLRSGGDGYEQFRLGRDETVLEGDMLAVAEQYLVDKEELFRKMAKPKIWELNLYLSVSSHYEKKDVDVDKTKYGEDIPKTWLSYTDFYKGDFIISSMNNKLTMNKIMGKHVVNSHLMASWSRTGSRVNTQKGIVYEKVRNHDPVELYNKYTYNLSDFPVKPYADLLVKSFLYSGEGQHPIAAVASSGMTRTFPKLLNLNVSIGIHGTRDYSTLKNSAGINGSFVMKKEFPAGKILKTPMSIDTTTRIQWNPLHEYFMTFQHENYNTIRFKIRQKVSLDVNVQTFSYRSTKVGRVALGFYYLLNLTYGMNWKF